MVHKYLQLSILGFALSVFSLFWATHAQSPVSSADLAELLLEPEELLLSSKESDFYFNLGDDSQILGTESAATYLEAFHQLQKQNPGHEYFSHPRKNREDFVSKFNRSRYPILFLTEKGEVGMSLSGKASNRWKKLDAFGVIQTNRPPGYLREDFHSADALDIPRWLVFNLIFAKKIPSRLEAALEKAGYNPKDQFVIYFAPEFYDWAVGDRIPLLPFVLPNELLTSRGYSPDELDFTRARVVFPQDAILGFEKTGDFRDLGSAGIHIPLKSNPSEELFLPISMLDKVYKTLRSIYLMSVGLANPKHFEELINQMNDLSEDLVSENFMTMEQAEDFGGMLSVLITETILHPTHLPEDNRAKDLQMHNKGIASRLTREGIRRVRRIKSSQLAEVSSQLVEKTGQLLGREEGKSLEQDKQELRELTQNYLDEQRAIRFGIQESRNWPNAQLESGAPSSESAPKKNWRKRLIIGSICALPFATVATRLLPVLASEWDQILPYAGTGSLFASLTATGFVWYAYLRNSSIRDARAQGLLYEDKDARTTKLLEKTDKLEDENSNLTEEERLELAIESRSTESAGLFRRTGNFLRNFRDHLKIKSIHGWYGIRSLENRAEDFRENPQSAGFKSSLELLGSVMAKAWGTVFAFPWHRAAVSAAFPFYFDTVQRGGRASIATWQDRALWPAPYYWTLRAATYGTGFLYGGFKPDHYWEMQSNRREASIQVNALIEPAVQRSVRQLCIAKALDLGMNIRLIPSILSVNRHIHQQGLKWLIDLQRRLPEKDRLPRESLVELVAYSDEVSHLAQQNYFLERMRVKLAGVDEEASSHQKAEVLSAYAKEQILKEIEYLSKAEDEIGEHYRQWTRRIRTRWSRVRMNHHETFFRIGKSGENMTRPKALLNLGRYPYTHLQDRLIITAQVVPMIAAKSLHTGMTDAELFNGLAPIFLFVGPDNLQAYGSGLATSSKMIDQLLEGRIPNERQAYGPAILNSLKTAPWTKIALQSANMIDLRLLTAANSALLMVGMLYPIDIVLTGWNSIFGSQEFLGTAVSKGAGRLANGLAGASINFGFGLASTPIYRSLMYARRAAGGIGSNGYQTISQPNPHQFSDKVFFSSVQVALNIAYGITSGWGVPLISEQLLNVADVQVAGLTDLASPIATGSIQSDCTNQLKAAVSLLRQAQN